MTPVNDVLPFAPQIAGCCLFSLFDVMPWLILTFALLIAIAAIVCLAAKRDRPDRIG